MVWFLYFKGICKLLTAHHWSSLSVFFSLTLTLTCRLLTTGPVSLFLFLTLTCRINTLVCTILLSKQQIPLPTMLLLYWFWLTEICICCKPRPTRDETCDRQNCTPNDAHTSTFLYFQYSTRKTHSCHFQTLR